MKRLSLVFFLVLMLCVFGVAAGEEACTSHSAACTAPGVCITCGYTGEDITVSHSWQTSRSYDNTHCWYACDNCDEKNDYQGHLIDAHDGITCCLCMATNVTGECDHCADGDLTHYYDDTQHWYICIGEHCQQPFYFRDHTPNCKGICTECGKTGLTPIDHVVDYNFDDGYDENYHWDNCDVCGEERLYSSNHWVDCGSTTCSTCGAENVQGPGTHNVTDADLEYDETNHWYNCPDCLQEVNKNDHYYTCTSTTTCVTCGYVTSGTTEYDHYWTTVYESDNPEYHYKRCSTCNGEYDAAAHNVVCTNAGVCTVCGATGIEAELNHIGELKWQNMGDTDSLLWSCCDTVVTSGESHSAVCSAPTTCTLCGETGIDCELQHEWGDHYDATEHWVACNLCGVELENSRDVHYAYCTAPTTCYVCFTEGEGFLLVHTESQKWQNDGDTHSLRWTCCDAVTLSGESHSAVCTAPTTCTVCAAEGIVCDASHEWADHYDATEHWVACNLCGVERENTRDVHYAYCTDPNTCYVCFTEGEGFQVVHTDSLVAVSDGATHSIKYLCCGAVERTGEAHAAYCTEDATKCCVCNAEGVETTIRHGNGTMIIDGDWHWYGCEDCKEPFGDKDTHHVTCDSTDRSVCSICGVAVDPDTVGVGHVELGLTEWEYDEDTHWKQFCVCGEMVDSDIHWVSCDAPDAGCAVCGYTEGNMPVYHAFGSAEYIDGEYHQEYCVRCGDAQQGTHWSFSCLSNICEGCGEAFENTNPSHSWNEMEYDASGHWYTCVECGETVSPESHWYYCADPDTCMTCGYVSPTATNYSHYWTTVYESDNPDYHYKHCITCDAEYAIASHTVSCANPGVCTGCGATGVTVESVSHGNVTWENNATKHWGVCGTCNETLEEGLHWTDCSKPNLCQDCGATGVTIDPSILSHFDVDWNNYEHDETHHWYTCRTCNVKAFYKPHNVKCSAGSAACSDCGYAGDFAVTHEALKAGWVSDEANHWKVCAVCDDVANKEAHVDDNENDECDTCKQALAHTHKWGEPVTVAATCTADGSVTTTCSSCGEKTVGTIKATGHAWGEPVTVDATCTADGSKTTACANCGEKTVETIAATGHAWGEPVTVAATCTADGSKTTACANCDEKTVETIKATGHAWGEPVTVDATCTADGSTTTTCAACGEKTVETIKATGHAWGEPVTVAATCTADGSTTTTCANCGEKTVETIKATGHAWGEPVTVDATCTADGSKTTACANCGEKTVEAIAATGHAWGEPVTVAATCTVDGSKTTACANCDEKTVETIAATGHAWGEPVTVDATCTADGSKTTTCANCGEKTVETIKATGHAWGEPVTVDATCTADGGKTTTCANCDEKTVETIAATGHAWGEPVTVDATCTADGSKTIACANCDEKTVETIAATGHAWGEPVTVDATCTADGSTTTTCANCGEQTVEVIPSLGGHKWKTAENVAATCTTGGRVKKICSVCNIYTVSTSAATGHAWGEPVTVAATCTADGSKTIACANCDEKTVETIAATGHAWGDPVTVAATCTADGSKTTTCATCGEQTVETIAAKGHAWGEPVTVDATCTADGSTTTTCATCGEQTVETVAAKGHAYGLVYTTQNNGTHAKFCADCGAIQTAKCTMTTTQLGSMTCSACATCGYTVYTFNEAEGNEEQAAAEAETTDEAETAESTETVEETESAVTGEEVEAPQTVTEAKAETVVKRVENVSFEIVAPVVPENAETEAAAEETESVEAAASAESEEETAAEEAVEAEEAAEEPEPVDYSDVVLVVHETNVEMDVELPDTVTAEVKKVLAVSMLKEGNSIQPAAAVKLSIPVAEEEVTGLKLVLMMEDGQLVELEYEIINGVIVFETDIVGVFLFVDAKTAGA